MRTDIKPLTPLEQKAVAFIEAVQNRQSPGAIEAFYHPDVEQVEFPNAVTKTKAVRNLAELAAASLRGKKVMAKEVYAVKNVFSTGNTVVVESEWMGTTAIAIGSLQPGYEMKAYFAQFFEFRDGLIFRQRNYDCFVPFN